MTVTFATTSKDKMHTEQHAQLGMSIDHMNARYVDLVSITASTLTLTPQEHAGRLLVLNRAAGIAVQLPAATGSGIVFKFLIGTTVTSNATTIKVTTTDTMTGFVTQFADGGTTANNYEVTGTNDTINMDGSTQGGILGDYIEVVDIATTLWWVRVIQSATGTEATPMAATVS